MGRPTVEIVPATPAHAAELAARMRQADAAEVLASSGYTPAQALEDALRSSSVARAALFDGEVACLWGLVPLKRSVIHGRLASAWLLTSDLVEKHPRAFWRGCREEVPALFDHADVLVNAIDARHHQALRWGERLGFRFGPPTALGPQGLPFHWFRFTREDFDVRTCRPGGDGSSGSAAGLQRVPVVAG